MQQEMTHREQLLDRGPSFSLTEINDPVWITRKKLGPRFEELEHNLSRYQFDVHLGEPMPVEFYQNGKKLRSVLHFGDLTWTPAGDSCRATWKKVRDVGFVSLSPAFLEQTAAEAGLDKLPDYASFQNTDPLTRELVLALVHHQQADALYTETLADALVVHLLSKAQKRQTKQLAMESKLSNQQLHRATDYVEDRLSDDIDLRSWAREAGLSPYHFARLFKRTTGFAPHQFLLHRRIERAKSVLACSDRPLSAVAYDLGFANQSHFHRVFRQFTQMTPGAWRARSN